MEGRSHPPLRRISRGEPLRVDPSLQVVRDPVEIDSCYSSGSEDTHPSLSRESSDALSSELGSKLQIAEPVEPTTPVAGVSGELIDFARNLGYSEEQLVQVLTRVGCDAGKDRVLSELVRLGRGDTPQCDAAPEAASTPRGDTASALRSIVIDGSNIAMTHGRKEVFSCAGVRDCVQFFSDRGHNDILVFIPHFRRETARADCPITDQHVLKELDDQGKIVWTPSRRINGRRIVCHDDRYILKTAEEKEAVIVSNDEYRDLVRENPQYRKLVETRLLMYSFVDGRFMPPDDPMGRHGPKLERFLSRAGGGSSLQPCPYARKCTYGIKCKYFHPERGTGHLSITDRLTKDRMFNQKRSLTARPSVPVELLKAASTHNTVFRTQSLNSPLSPEQPQQYRRPTQLPFVSGWPGSCSGIQNMNPMNNRVDDGSLMFAPSTAVWGHSELSVGPLHTSDGGGMASREQMRVRLQYNLSQLFHPTEVMAVMAAHPEETSSQVLCEHIINMKKSFHSTN